MYISQMYIHPVKSFGGIAVEQFEVDCFGPRWDRRWMVVDPQGKFITQRQCVEMAAIDVEFMEGRVVLTGAEGSTVAFTPEDFAAGESIEARVWRDQVQARLGPQWLEQWLTHELGRPCNLVFMPEQSQRKVDPNYAKRDETVSFADGFPLLLTSQASLDFLNSKMSIAITQSRFRPNLVVEAAQPWQEDNWKRIRVGAMEFEVVKPCSRCVIPTIDPSSLKKQPEVFNTLKQYRSQGGEVFFGQNLIPIIPPGHNPKAAIGEIHCSDKLVVLE